jgi:hypothetical protein
MLLVQQVDESSAATGAGIRSVVESINRLRPNQAG